MIHEETFRSRAQIVRQSARAHLLDIRRARLAKRGPRADTERAGRSPEELWPEERGAEGNGPDRQGEVDAADLPDVQPAPDAIVEPVAETSAEAGVQANTPAKPEPHAEPDAGASFVSAEKAEFASLPCVEVAERIATTGQYDDLDAIARKNIAANELPMTVKEPPLRLTKPILPGSVRDLTSSGRPIAEKKVAKPKSRKPVPAPSPADDLDDRAVRNAALADLAEEPEVGVPSRPVALPSPAPTDPDSAAWLDAQPAVGTQDASAISVLSADLQAAETASADAVMPSAAAPMATPPGPLEPEPMAQFATLTGTIPAAPESDLRSLPGAGPGLIWMLQQCDIHSLQDLAGTEAAVLVPKLGLVGQILNVDIWLDYARKAQAPQGQ